MCPNRRDFLRTSLGASTLLSLAPTVPSFLSRTALAGAENRADRDTVLVVVQLAGGNDGLNTLIPYGDDAYHRSRPTLRQVAEGLHKIDEHVGFHPRMAGFKKLFDEGWLSVVRGVGYPDSSRDHATAMQVWQTAKPEEPRCPTGWLGRAIDEVAKDGEVPGVFMGTIALPVTLNAQSAVVPTVRSLQDLTLQTAPGSQADGQQRRRLEELAEKSRPGGDADLLRFVQRTTLAAYATSKQVAAAAEPGPATSVAYPSNSFAEQLQSIVRLVRADLGIRIYFTDMMGGGFGGFDNHANQLGNHCALLGQLSESVTAFVEDLRRERLLDRVVLMTFSEFGRTLKENGRRGTDHGAAAPVFLAGGGLQGGLIGPQPSLTDLHQDSALKIHTDFRCLYAMLLDQWLGFDSQAALGAKFKPLDALRV